MGYALPFILILAVLGIIPSVKTWIEGYSMPEVLENAYAAITGKQITTPGVFGVLSMIIGIISGIATFIKTSQTKTKQNPIACSSA